MEIGLYSAGTFGWDTFGTDSFTAVFHCFGTVAVFNERFTRCASGPARTGAARRKNHAGIPSAPSAVWWRESSILNIRASVTRLLFLVTVHFFAGVWYCGSCEMAAWCKLSASASRLPDSSCCLFLLISLFTSFQSSAVPQSESSFLRLQLFALTILRPILRAKADASSSRPRCINLFFLRSKNLISGVRYAGSAEVRVIFLVG